MSTGRTDGFHKDAVRIALTSGLTRRQVADDLGVGLSTLEWGDWFNNRCLLKPIGNIPPPRQRRASMQLWH